MTDNRYRSSKGTGLLTAAQYLAELSCMRVAAHDHVHLPEGYWKSSKWLREFQIQSRNARRLLGMFDTAAVFAAWKSPAAKKIWSIGSKKFLPIVEREQQKIDRQSKAGTCEPIELPTDEVPRPVFTTVPCVLSKLREIE